MVTTLMTVSLITLAGDWLDVCECQVLFSTRAQEQDSTLTQNDTGPVGPVTPSICWSCKILTGPTFFLEHNKKEHCIKFTTTFIFVDFIFIYFKNIWGHSWGKPFNKNVSKCLLGL